MRCTIVPFALAAFALAAPQAGATESSVLGKVQALFGIESSDAKAEAQADGKLKASTNAPAAVSDATAETAATKARGRKPHLESEINGQANGGVRADSDGGVPGTTRGGASVSGGAETTGAAAASAGPRGAATGNARAGSSLRGHTAGGATAGVAAGADSSVGASIGGAVGGAAGALGDTVGGSVDATGVSGSVGVR